MDYKLRNYRHSDQLGQEPTHTEYINKLCDIFDECKRILRKDGTCWIVISDTYNTKSGGMEDLVRGNRTQYGKVKYSFEGVTQKQKLQSNIKKKSLMLIPERMAIEMVDRGWILRNKIIWKKPNCMPSSVKDRFTIDYEFIYFFVKSDKYWFDKQYEPMNVESVKRAFRRTNPKNKYNKDLGHNAAITPQSTEVYNQKIRTLARDKGLLIGAEFGGKKRAGGDNPNYSGKVWILDPEFKRAKRNIWELSTEPFKGNHYAAFPKKLVQVCLDAGCPKEICNLCGVARVRIVKHKLESVTGESYINKSIDNKPYSVVGREGTIAYRKLPNIREFADFLNNHRIKKGFTIDNIEQDIFHSQAPHHWFAAESFPSISDWKKLKDVLDIDDNRYEEAMTKEYYKPAEKMPSLYVNNGWSNCGCNAGFSGGIILDPFMGVATTAVVAIRNNCYFTGVELNPEYIEAGLLRIKQENPLFEWISPIKMFKLQGYKL